MNKLLTSTLLLFVSNCNADELVAAKQKATITVGATIPLVAEGDEIRQGYESAFRACNTAQGIPNARIVLDARDDRKSIAHSIRLIHQLIKQTPIIASVFTAGTLHGILPLIKSKKIVIFGPNENSDELYSPDLDHIIHTRPPLSEEIRLLVDYSIRYLNRGKFAIFYEESTVGMSGLASAKKVIQEYRDRLQNSSIRLVSSAPHPRGTVEVNRAAETIAETYPETVICIARRHATYNFILKALNKGLMRTAFLGTTYLLAIQEALSKARGIPFITSSYLPDMYAQEPYKIIESYKRDLALFVPGEYPNPISLAAYINARILLAILAQIKGEPSARALVAQAKKLNQFGLEGLELTYNPRLPAISHQLWISPGYGKPYVVWKPQDLPAHKEQNNV